MGYVTSCMTRLRSGRPAKVEQKMQLEDVFIIGPHIFKQQYKREKQNLWPLKKSVWENPKEIRCSSIPTNTKSGITGWVAERHFAWCNFVMNQIEVQPTFLAGIMWTHEACFSQNKMYNRQNIHYWARENPSCSADV
ncbi:hypothetical protein X975_07523, partial [Stegodyphus mimosarum]